MADPAAIKYKYHRFVPNTSKAAMCCAKSRNSHESQNTKENKIFLNICFIAVSPSLLIFLQCAPCQRGWQVPLEQTSFFLFQFLRCFMQDFVKGVL